MQDLTPGLEAVRHLDEVTRRLRQECPWDREQPENLPALLYARKVLRRVDPEGSAGDDKPGGPQADPAERAEAEQLVGTLLLEAVAASRQLGVDPELALRQAAKKLED